MSSQMQNIAKTMFWTNAICITEWLKFKYIWNDLQRTYLIFNFARPFWHHIALPFWEQYAQAHIIQRSAEIGPKLQL
jgi:uncharacterized protein with PQ loop repeat